MASYIFRVLVICIAAIATAAILVWGVGWSKEAVLPGCITSALLTIVLMTLDRVRTA